MRTAWSRLAPAASATILRLSRQRRALPPGDPWTSSFVAGSRCTWRERKTSPAALTACEYGPAALGPSVAVTVSRSWDMSRTVFDAEPPRLRNLAVSPSARGQPRGLVPVGRGGVRRRARAGPAAAGLDRLRGVPLVPCDGARVVRGSGGRFADERLVRLREGRPRGAPGRRRDLHGGHPGDDRPGRLAAERLPDAGGRAVLGG